RHHQCDFRRHPRAGRRLARWGAALDTLVCREADRNRPAIAPCAKSVSFFALGVVRHRPSLANGSRTRTRRKENARGERAFSVVDFGVFGVFYISTWRLWGAGKGPREFLKNS